FHYPYDAAKGTDATTTTTTTTTTATTRVIQVGNMLQVLPQDASAPQPHSAMIVQAGNVIQEATSEVPVVGSPVPEYETQGFVTPVHGDQDNTGPERRKVQGTTQCFFILGEPE
ncbi:hypothetical protein O3P69_012358, partial [Scylla paramamosain]